MLRWHGRGRIAVMLSGEPKLLGQQKRSLGVHLSPQRRLRWCARKAVVRGGIFGKGRYCYFDQREVCRARFSLTQSLQGSIDCRGMTSRAVIGVAKQEHYSEAREVEVEEG